MFVVLRDPLLPPPRAGWVNHVTKSYDDQSVAEAEAERLAREHGGRFLVMQAISGIAAETVVKVKRVYNFDLNDEREARLAAQAERATSGGDGEGATMAELNAELDPDVDRRASEAELDAMPF